MFVIFSKMCGRVLVWFYNANSYKISKFDDISQVKYTDGKVQTGEI